MKIKLSEAQVKLAVAQYLQFQQNLGKLMFLRLQSGSLLVKYGESMNRVQLCPPGTADIVVFQAEKVLNFVCRVTFLEIKSSKGKQSPDQAEFEKRAIAQNCRYFLVRDAGEMPSILA